MHVEKSFWLFSLRIKLFRPFTAKSHHTSVHVAELPGGSSGSLYLPNRLIFPRLFSVFISCNLLLFSVCLAQLHKCSVFAREPPEAAEVNNCKRCVTTAVLLPPSLQACKCEKSSFTFGIKHCFVQEMVKSCTAPYHQGALASPYIVLKHPCGVRSI